jgi:proton glutamate symport protein
VKLSLTAQLMLALVVGLVLGLIISASDSEAVRRIPTFIEPIGTLWANAIRMTVIPLIVSLLISAIVSDSQSTSVASTGGRTLLLFAVFVAGSSLFAALAGPPLLALFPLDPAAAASLRPSGPPRAVELPPFRNWLVDLVPTNPVKSLADGSMLPILVFTIAFALALNRITGPGRDVVTRAFNAIKETMFVLIGWILAVGPIGVFALVLALTARMGAAAAGALGYFVLIACVLLVVSIIALYPVVAAFGRVSLRAFARALAPAQAVAFTTRSSLAALPALVTGADKLGLPQAVSGLTLPLGVSVFKYSSPIARIVGTLFIAKLYGIPLSPGQIAAIALALGILSFYSPGIPSGGLFVLTPVYVAFGLPVEGVGILIALDFIPDMFITTSNVTADQVVTVLMSRSAVYEPVALEMPEAVPR